MTFREEFWDAFTKIEIANDLSIEEKMAKLSSVHEILRPHLPKSLYKYRECSTRNLDALTRNVLYAVPASYMNDDFDSLVYVDKEYLENSVKYGLSKNFIEDVREQKSLPASLEKLIPAEVAQGIVDSSLKLTEEEIEKRVNENTQSLQQILKDMNQYIEASIKDLQHNSLISSFSTTPCDPSMWNRYAGGEKGFVLEYAVDGVRFDYCGRCKDAGTKNCDGTKVSSYLYPIVYLKERYDATAWIDNRIGRQVLENSGLVEESKYIPDILVYDKCCLVKGDSWAKEDEWRIICYPDFPMHHPEPVAIHTPVPSAIYYGSKISDEDFRLLHKTIEEFRSKGAVIKEYKMYLDLYSRGFELKFKEMSQ